MEIASATAASATSTGQSSSAFSELEGEAFLKLLVAQLQNQDPLNPLDNQEFMSQMAQLSSVEKLQSIDQTLSASTVAGELSLGASLIGKQVQWLNADGEPQLGTVTEVAHSADGTALQIGDQRVALASLVRIAAAAASTE